MWEMSKYNSSGGSSRIGGFNGGGEKMIQTCGGGDHFGNRHSISFKSGGDMNSSSSSLGKFALAGGGMLGVNSSSKAPTTAALGGLPPNSVPGLNPDVELAVEWSPDEQLILEDGLSKYADEPNILKYIKISAALPEKTVRDVALRCRWMTKKENGKRRKPEEFYTGKKMKDRKEKAESSCKSSLTPAPPLNMGAYPLMMHHTDQRDRISCEVQGIGGTTRHLLDENTQLFSHITANLASFKIQENVDLFCRTRKNILGILNDMRGMPGIMSQMPPLPVSMNEELANAILPNNNNNNNTARQQQQQTLIYCSPPTTTMTTTSTIYGKSAAEGLGLGLGRC